MFFIIVMVDVLLVVFYDSRAGPDCRDAEGNSQESRRFGKSKKLRFLQSHVKKCMKNT
jgi:hypothetical protein